MNSSTAKRICLQAAALAGIWAACFFSGTPVQVAAALLRVAIVIGAVHIFSRGRTGRGQVLVLLLAWVLTILALLLLPHETERWNGRFTIGRFLLSVLAWLVAPLLLAVSAWLTGARFADPTPRDRWRALAALWAFSAAAILLTASYLANEPVVFYVAILAGVGLLIAWKKVFSLRALGIQVANTLILLLIGLPLASLLLYGLTDPGVAPDPAKKYYSYEVATKNLKLYEHWGNSFWGQWQQDMKEIVVSNQPGANPPFHLKPNSHVKLIDSLIDINNQGFRGRDFAVDKAASYRIVVLGESTTFGFTITATDQPWPARLEQLIHDRLKLARPVEVINAGTFAFDLNNNVARLSVDILRLKPDLIISYHGLNGFRWLDPSLPSIFGRPPGYRRRPLMLLAEAEFKLRLARFNRERAAPSPVKTAAPGDPLQSEYARNYRDLIQIARTNHIRLVLANYSMAVNRASDSKIKEFYRLTFPDINGVIAANEAHTAIVEQLGREHPELTVADSHPNLDGRHDEYIDLVHFTEAGEAQMAENIFNRLKPLLEAELSPPPAPR